MQGRHDDAKKILEKIHSSSSKGQDLAHAEFYQIQRQVLIDRELDSSWVQLFKKPSYRKRAFLGIGTTGIVQFAGVLVINSRSSSHRPKQGLRHRILIKGRLRSCNLRAARLQRREATSLSRYLGDLWSRPFPDSTVFGRPFSPTPTLGLWHVWLCKYIGG